MAQKKRVSSGYTKRVAAFLADEEAVQELVYYLQAVCSNHPIKSSQIEQSLRMTGVEIRAIMHQLRKEHPIGSGGKGYYYCMTKEELIATIEHLNSRIRSTMEARDWLLFHLKNLRGL